MLAEFPKLLVYKQCNVSRTRGQIECIQIQVCRSYSLEINVKTNLILNMYYLLRPTIPCITRKRQLVYTLLK